jgi:hypothetical protein
MTPMTFTIAHWYAQKMRRYPRWDNYTNARAYAYDFACAYAYDYARAYTRAYARAYAHANVGRYNLARATGGPQR